MNTLLPGTAIEDRHVLPVLEARGIRKSFFGTRALDDVDLVIRPGEVHGLVGENGSGKSTLVKILAGVYTADAGVLEPRDGEPVEAGRMTPAISRELGIDVVHQDAPIFGALSVAENLFIGRRFPRRAGGRIDRRAMRRHAREVLERFHVPARPDQSADDLDPALRSMLAIARALQDREQRDSGLLILDEPTAALTHSEVDLLLDAIRRYATEGQAIVLVTHRLDEILDSCARVTVLRDGALVAERQRHEIERQDLIDLIVGRDITQAARARAARQPEDEDVVPALAVRGLRGGPLDGVDLAVAPGEIVGVAGLVGSGRTELLEMVYGERRRAAGDVLVHGVALAGRGAKEAMGHGVAFVPEDRARDALFATQTTRENLSVSVLPTFWRGGRMRRDAERVRARALVDRFQVAPADPEATIANLSGGNQQKVVLARWLQREPRLLLLDEPSQGVDIGARVQIHDAVRATAQRGAGVLVVSSDAEELVELCDRVVVLVGGRIAAAVSGDDVDRVRLVGLMHAEDPQEIAATKRNRA